MKKRVISLSEKVAEFLGAICEMLAGIFLTVGFLIFFIQDNPKVLKVFANIIMLLCFVAAIFFIAVSLGWM